MNRFDIISISYSDCFGFEFEILGITIERSRYFFGSIFKLVISKNYIGFDLFFKRIFTWER